MSRRPICPSCGAEGLGDPKGYVWCSAEGIVTPMSTEDRERFTRREPTPEPRQFNRRRAPRQGALL